MTTAVPFMPEIPDLRRTVVELWRQIPPGRVSTYGSIAKALGSIAASRWVGTFAKNHEHTDECNCHRLVRADGSLGAYISGDPNEKAMRLASEGVPVANDKIKLAEHQFSDFSCASPLTPLADYQQKIACLVDVSTPLGSPVERVGGVDVSYTTSSQAVAAYVIVDSAGELQWSHTVSRETRFPYISGFLAFRELPILIALIDEVREAGQLAEVTMVDGSGILHPRRTGVASMLGVATGIRTIGVTKKILCGKPARPILPDNKMVPVEVDGQSMGGAMLPVTGSQRPLYFSPGHLIEVASTLTLSRQQCSHFRLPMPIYWADKISRKVANQA